MAIDQSVGALGEYMAHINTSASYNKIRYKAYKLLRKLHLIDEKHKDIILRFNNSLKALLTNQQNIFEETADFNKLKETILVVKKDMEFEEIKLIGCKFDQIFLTGK